MCVAEELSSRRKKYYVRIIKGDNDVPSARKFWFDCVNKIQGILVKFFSYIFLFTF